MVVTKELPNCIELLLVTIVLYPIATALLRLFDPTSAKAPKATLKLPVVLLESA